MGIGSKLDHLIKIRGRNVNDVAKAANVPASTVYSIIKRDNTKADLEDLQQIAHELGVTLEYFVDSPKDWQPQTIAAHHDGEEWTPEELAQIEQFKAFVKSQRKPIEYPEDPRCDYSGPTKKERDGILNEHKKFFQTRL